MHQTSGGPRARVLVVDDDLASRILALLLLDRCGCEATGVPSVRRALTHLEEEEVDLVLTDLMMPVQTGIDLLATLGALPARIPALAMSASDDERLLHQALDLGATTVLRKPLFREDLEDALVAALDTVPAVHRRAAA
jgi:CheY-like chemotaxis protein